MVLKFFFSWIFWGIFPHSVKDFFDLIAPYTYHQEYHRFYLIFTLKSQKQCFKCFFINFLCYSLNGLFICHWPGLQLIPNLCL